MATKGRTISKSYLIGGGYAALVLGFLLAGILPFLLGMSAAQKDIGNFQREIDTRIARSRELQDAKGQIALLELETRDFDRLVPRNQDLGTFLTQLYEQLGAAGMKDISVRNLAPTQLGRSQRLPIEVRGKGTYAQFHSFLVRLEDLRRLSSVGKLTIDADADMSGNVEVQLTLFIYSAKPS
jgi:Tfp pilus assembly protein PilO